MSATPLASSPHVPLRSRVAGGAALVRTAGDSIPPAGLVLIGILSVQAGAGVAKNLFAVLPPSAVVCCAC